MLSELEKLKKQVKELEEKQAHCAHCWNEPERDFIEEDIEDTKMVGTDLIIYKTGETKMIPCWSRYCEKCGKKEYTKEEIEVPIQTVTKPKFRN